jgi:hypothetical protein
MTGLMTLVKALTTCHDYESEYGFCIEIINTLILEKKSIFWILLGG